MDRFPEQQLAPAQLIAALGPVTDDQRYIGWVRNVPAGEIPDSEWSNLLNYSPEEDEDNHLTCSPQGLEPWTAYVATDSDGTVTQFSLKPYPVEFGAPTYDMCWCVDMGSPTVPGPVTHRYPGDVRQSLMRVNDV